MKTVTVVDDTDADTDLLPDESSSSVWHFDLEQVVRDQDSNTQSGAGIINEDDVEVVVDGRIQVYPDDFRYSVDEDAGPGLCYSGPE